MNLLHRRDLTLFNGGILLSFRLGPMRSLTKGTLLKLNRKTFWVRLKNGEIIKRKIQRDLIS